MWPAHLEDDRPGTVYVHGSKLAEFITAANGGGQAWRFRGQWSSFMPRRGQLYKSYRGLYAQTPDPQDFAAVMHSAQAAGCKPPASFADIFKQAVYQAPPAPRGALAFFRGRTFGGWEEAWTERAEGPIYWYDIRSAYRWAACQGLPDPRTLVILTPRADDPLAVWMAELDAGTLPYAPAAGTHYITEAERAAFGIGRDKLRHGLGARRAVDLRPVFARVDRAFPHCAKRISRAFWGVWNSSAPSERVSWRTGERVSTLRNKSYNPTWALWITARVKLRLAEIPGKLHAFVDSVLTRAPLPTGDDVGAWRMVEPEPLPSVWIRWPGYFGSGPRVIKHAGEKVAAP